VAGIVFAIASAVAFGMLSALPRLTASDEEIAAFYSEPGTGSRGLVALQVMVLAVIGFIWFIAVIRNRMGKAEPKLFSTVFFGGGILVAALLLQSTAAMVAPSVVTEIGGRVPDAGAVSMMRGFGSALLLAITPRFQALFIFSMSALGMRTGVLPTWLNVLGVVVGLGLLINVTFFTPSVYIFPAWVAVVSVVLLIRPRPLSPA